MASYQPYYLAVARYAHGNKTANLLNNQTKSGKESIDRFGFITFRNLRETSSWHNGLSAEAERDKSRPYACRIACFQEDAGT